MVEATNEVSTCPLYRTVIEMSAKSKSNQWTRRKVLLGAGMVAGTATVPGIVAADHTGVTILGPPPRSRVEAGKPFDVTARVGADISVPIPRPLEIQLLIEGEVEDTQTGYIDGWFGNPRKVRLTGVPSIVTEPTEKQITVRATVSGHTDEDNSTILVIPPQIDPPTADPDDPIPVGDDGQNGNDDEEDPVCPPERCDPIPT